MGRQNKDTSVVGSSIVLLQERFKQLQRLKEMREEKQSLKLLSQSTDDGYDEPAKLGANFSPSFQDPLALGLNSNIANHMAHFRAMKPQQLNSAARGSHSCFEKSDVVDTSLRL